MAMPWETTLSIRDGLMGTCGQVVEDAGPTLAEIPIDMFCEHILPRPTIIDHLDSILNNLAKTPGRWGAYDRKMKRWRAISDGPQEEGTVFAKLKIIAESISTVARNFEDGQQATTRFEQDPTRAPEADWRTPRANPDGYFVLNETRGSRNKARWEDVAATGEFKRVDQKTRHLDDVGSTKNIFSS